MHFEDKYDLKKNIGSGSGAENGIWIFYWKTRIRFLTIFRSGSQHNLRIRKTCIAATEKISDAKFCKKSKKNKNYFFCVKCCLKPNKKKIIWVLSIHFFFFKQKIPKMQLMNAINLLTILRQWFLSESDSRKKSDPDPRWLK